MADVPSDLPPFPPDPEAPPPPSAPQITFGRGQPAIFGWADTPWTVAALLGAWGVMIGIEEFFLADVFMVLAGVSCTARLAKDCFQNRRHRWVPFVLWLGIIVTVTGVDIHLTARKKESSEAKESQITNLTTKVGQLNGTVQHQSIALSAAQGHTDQHVSDIQEENKRLRSSIDKKDAALVSIANQQLALNTFPQIMVADNGTTNEVVITNYGKTNVTVTELDVEAAPQEAGSIPALITPAGPGSGIRFTLHDQTKNAIASRAPGGNAVRLPVECEVHFTNQDGKKYMLGFTWLFDVKDGEIVKTGVIDRPVVEVKQP